MTDTSAGDHVPGTPGLTVSQSYDRWAQSYDEIHNATRDVDARVLRSAGLVLGGHEVLELGAGTGKNSVWLAEQARHVTALDMSEGMLARARVRLPATNVTFVIADLRSHWPVADASVDTVVGNLVLEHLADLGHIFREIARVLRPGGEAYVAELHPDRQRQGSRAQFTDASTGERILVDAYVHTIDEYRSAARTAGLREISFTAHHDDGATTAALPRILAMRFRAS